MTDPDPLTITELDVLADTLNEVLERAQTVLGRYKVTASVDIEGLTGQLGLKKVGREWCLVWFSNDGEPPGYSLVLNASRQLRILAAENIPKLHEAILAQRSSVVERTREAIENLEAFIEALEKEQPDG